MPAVVEWMRSGLVIGVGCILGVGLACASFGDAMPPVARRAPQQAISATQVSAASSPVLELGPPTSQALLIDVPAYSIPELADGDLGLFAYYYATHVYQRPSSHPKTLGLVRRGTILRAAKAVSGPGCSHGKWYALEDQGYACEGRGFSLKQETHPRQLRPNVRRSLPFRYGKVNSRKALRYYRIPTLDEEAEIEAARAKGTKLPDVVADELDGDYFVAIDREEADGDRRYYRTVLGRYVLVADVDLRQEPTMQGELLQGDKKLPMAFVYGQGDVPLLKQEEGHMVVIGKALKHARFPVVGAGSWGDKDVVVSPQGFGVERQFVRVARRHERPAGVDEDDKWIHVDLDHQVLVAYVGDKPVFVTLVSTGREGHDTPTGLYRIHEKHKTTTMRGSPPGEAPFEVGEVPWTMFYRGSYALHGAYWHNDFGKVRSHGCTNLAPIDARWLFHFADGELPMGWHALRKLESTQVYFTRQG